MAMKVKFFREREVPDLEKDVNKWLEENTKSIDVKYVTQSLGVAVTGPLPVLVGIWYTEEP